MLCVASKAINRDGGKDGRFTLCELPRPAMQFRYRQRKRVRPARPDAG
jgi:hypothetical protein